MTQPAPPPQPSWLDVGTKFLTSPIDSTKRLISNLPTMYGYNKSHLLAPLHHLSELPRLVSADAPALPTTAGAVSFARRELMRRGMGVHRDETAKGLPPTFQPSNRPGHTVELHDRFFNPDGRFRWSEPGARDVLAGVFTWQDRHDGQATINNLVEGMRRARQTGHGFRPNQAPGALGAYVHTGVFSNTPVVYRGNGIFDVMDTWDVGLNNSGDKNWKNPFVTAGRYALDKLMPRPATFSQSFQFTKGNPAPIRQNIPPAHLLPAQKAPPPKLPTPTVNATVQR